MTSAPGVQSSASSTDLVATLRDMPVLASDPVVRPMTLADLDAVVAIENDASTRPWSRDLFEADLRPDNVYLVAESASEVVGFAGFSQIVDEGHITNVAVARSQRRTGVAQRLLLDLVFEAIDRGICDLTLEVRSSNQAALALYRKFGFAPEGIRRGYYQDPSEDALLLWARNIGGDRGLNRLRVLVERRATPPAMSAVSEQTAAMPATLTISEGTDR